MIGQLNKKLKQLADEGQKKHNKRMFEIQLQKNRVIEDCNFRIERLKSNHPVTREEHFVIGDAGQQSPEQGGGDGGALLGKDYL